MLEDDWNFSIFEDIMRQSELERYEGSTSTDAESDDTPTDVESDDTPTDVDSHDELWVIDLFNFWIIQNNDIAIQNSLWAFL